MAVGILAIAALGIAAFAFTKRRTRSNLRARQIIDDECAQLFPFENIETGKQWVKLVFVPLYAQALEVVRYDFEAQPLVAVNRLTSYVAGELAPHCKAMFGQGDIGQAAAQMWKGIWCEIAFNAAVRGLIDEEPTDIAEKCVDPFFDPRTLKVEPIPEGGP